MVVGVNVKAMEQVIVSIKKAERVKLKFLKFSSGSWCVGGKVVIIVREWFLRGFEFV